MPQATPSAPSTQREAISRSAKANRAPICIEAGGFSRPWGWCGHVVVVGEASRGHVVVVGEASRGRFGRLVVASRRRADGDCDICKGYGMRVSAYDAFPDPTAGRHRRCARIGGTEDAFQRNLKLRKAE